MNAFKEKVWKACVEKIQAQTDELNAQINELQESANNETKNSAGDKHETGRAMLHLEREKLEQRLSEIEATYVQIQRLKGVSNKQVSNGALVTTDKGMFFIACAMGKLVIEAQPIWVISAQAPLAVSMKGLTSGATFSFNQTTSTILEVV